MRRRKHRFVVALLLAPLAVPRAKLEVRLAALPPEVVEVPRGVQLVRRRLDGVLGVWLCVEFAWKIRCCFKVCWGRAWFH